MERRRRRLCLETLETRSLLSGLSYSLTTDQSTYQVGQSIHMTFTVTNTSDEPVDFGFDDSGDGFIVTQNGQTVWDSNGPNLIPISNNSLLQPGQSIPFHATWDGTIVGSSSIATTSGSFVVTNQLDPQGPSASFQIQSPLSYSLSVPQFTFGFGQAIAFSYTITDTSDQPVTFGLAPADFVVTWQDNTTIWQSDPGAASQSPTSETLQPGQSLTETATWNGLANQGALAGTDVWDDSAVSVLGAPAGVSQGFQITSPLSQQVTTNQPMYQAGEPVLITGTETNTSDQAVTILNVHDTFMVYGEGGVTLLAVSPSATNPIVALQPGQSQTFTATWNPDSTDVGGSYNIYFQDNFQGTFSRQFVISTVGSGSTGSPTSTGSQSPTSSTTSNPTGPLVITTLSTNRQVYRLGQSVRVTLRIEDVAADQTATNHKRVAATSGANHDRITVMEGSTLVWQSPRRVLTRMVRKIQPGQTIKLSTVWNGRSRESDIRKLTPGSYTVKAKVDGAVATTTITIEPGRSKAHR